MAKKKENVKSYGWFAKDNRSFIIKRPDTPRPWFNFLFNDDYHALVSQTGGGFSYYKDPKYHRVLRYDHVHTDRPGRYVFINDKKAKNVWSANWQPMRGKLDQWKCEHGLGFTRIDAKNKGVAVGITYIVPLKEACELWKIEVENTTNATKDITVVPMAELVMGDVSLENNYRNILCLYNKAYFDKGLNAVIANKFPYPGRKVRTYGFFASTRKAKAYDTNKERFFGRYNDVTNPQAVVNAKLGNTPTRGEDMVGALQYDLKLKPGQKVEFVIAVGLLDTMNDVKKVLKKFNTVTAFNKELEAIKAYWLDETTRLTVKTPDSDFDRMVNIWGRYQLYAITHWRGTSQYHGGEGGLGYRDTAQDCEGLFSLNMRIAKAKLMKILYYQYSSGHAVSGFSDIEGSWENTGEGGVTGKADVAVWLPFSVIAYLKETGDYKFLKEKVEFHDGGSATVYEHILRAARYIDSMVGENGFPLIGKADWNDAYDSVGIKGKGTSVWLAEALCRAFEQLGELAEYMGDKKVANEMRKRFDKMSKNINTKGWDGKWYLAAHNDEGLKIGSSKNKEGKVPLNSQTWAILGHVVPKNRLNSILKQIDKYLDTPYGPALFLPSYSDWNPGVGRVTTFAEGTKENAAVFSHACAFKVVADCELGRGDEAMKTYKALLPTSPVKMNDMGLYKVEPYVFSEYVVGPGHPYIYGEGSFTWNTGTAPWMFLGSTEWIMGARRDFGGLRIDPCIPKKWKECSIRRPFRGATYEIAIKNPKGVNKGVKQVWVDGKRIEGTLIEPHGDGKVHQVEVLMG